MRCFAATGREDLRARIALHRSREEDDRAPVRIGASNNLLGRMTPMASVDVEMVKCACPDCVCVVSLSKAVTRDDKAFCCDECAEGHPDHAGCDHAGCTCHG